MKVTGYQLREAIKQFELRRDTAARSFDSSLKAFPDEKDKEKPQEIVKQFLGAESAVAKLQTAQMAYNLRVQLEINFPGKAERMSLAEAIKRVGGEARSEKMWRSAAGPAPDRYGYAHSADVRNKDEVRATPTITTSEATKLASQAAKRAGAFRAAIATGNAREVELEDLDASLFE